MLLESSQSASRAAEPLASHILVVVVLLPTDAGILESCGDLEYGVLSL